MERSFKTELAGRELVIETGKLAQLASGSVLVRYGDTVVLATATMSEKPREGIDFFPLSVDYEEKLYAVGKIPGSFIKREGKPSEKAILTSRVIDRPIRPLFPSDLRNDVTVIAGSAGGGFGSNTVPALAQKLIEKYNDNENLQLLLLWYCWDNRRIPIIRKLQTEGATEKVREEANLFFKE